MKGAEARMKNEIGSMPFHLVDVFGVEPLTGNPLAVAEGGADLPLLSLQRIAREFNQSETTFLMSPTKTRADWRLRSFTAAGAEVFGAGHNALGAWWLLAAAGRLSLNRAETEFHQEIGEQVFPVMISASEGRPDWVVMRQEAPVFGSSVRDAFAHAEALGLSIHDIATEVVACQVISTGAPHLMVPLRDRNAVDRARPDAKALLVILKSCGGEGCYVFSLDPRQSGATAYARFFNPTVGISEDPATGTAAGPLAAHLVSAGLAAGTVMIEQGTSMGRTSLIQVHISGSTVKIAGRAVVVASGQLFI